MSTNLLAETKKSELWIAAGGDKLTSIVSIYYDAMALAGKIIIAGSANNGNKYIANVITAATVSDQLKRVTIDAGEMVFIIGHDINQCAIECLLQIIMSVVNRGGEAEVLVPCVCVGDVLTDVFGRQKALRHSVTIKTVISPVVKIPSLDTPASIDGSRLSSRDSLINA